MGNWKLWITSLIGLFSLSKTSCAQQTGYACIYSESNCGERVSTGQRLQCDQLTAAHLTYKFGTRIRVTNLDNGKTVIVSINDRGPFTKKYIIDMTPAAAQKIGLNNKIGRVKVKLEKVESK